MSRRSSTIKLAKNLVLDTTATTETFAILARKDGGKTYTGLKSFEEMHAAGAQCVAIDPVGKWWSLRLAADGKQPGIDLPIFGGLYADLPLEATAGALIARVIVERGISAVIDVSLFEDRDMKRFVTDFARELYRLKQREQSVLHLFVEEASTFMPQDKEDGSDPPMLNAFKKLVRKGRNYGIGVTLIDQRAQDVNKKVLNQTSILIVLGTSGTTDRAAIEKWVRDKHIDASGLDELASLPQGDAFVWQPRAKTFVHVHIAKRWTFDASATPKLGAKRVTRKLTPTDVTKLRDAIKESVARAAAEDPKELKKRVAQLEAALKQKKVITAVDDDVVDELRAEVAALETKLAKALARPTEEIVVIKDKDIKEFERASEKLQKALVDHMRELEEKAGRVTEATSSVIKKMGAAVAQSRSVVQRVVPPAPKRAPVAAKKTAPKSTDTSVKSSGPITKAQQRILDALAWFAAIGVTEPSRAAIAGRARMAQSGYFNNSMGALHTAELVAYPRGGCVSLTEAGAKVAETPTEQPTLAAFHASVMSVLKGLQPKILQKLIEVHPSAVSREELAASIDKSESGYFNNTLGSLRTMELVDYPQRGLAKAADVLFPDGLS